MKVNVGDKVESLNNKLYDYRVVKVKRGGWLEVHPIDKKTGREYPDMIHTTRTTHLKGA